MRFVVRGSLGRGRFSPLWRAAPPLAQEPAPDADAPACRVRGPASAAPQLPRHPIRRRPFAPVDAGAPVATPLPGSAVAPARPASGGPHRGYAVDRPSRSYRPDNPFGMPFDTPADSAAEASASPTRRRRRRASSCRCAWTDRASPSPSAATAIRFRRSPPRACGRFSAGRSLPRDARARRSRPGARTTRARGRDRLAENPASRRSRP